MPNVTTFDKLTGKDRASETVIARWIVAEKVHNRQVERFDKWARI